MAANLLDGFNDWMAANKKLVSTEVGRIAKDLGRGLSSIDWRGMARSVLALGHGIGKLVDFVGGPRNALIGLAVVMNAQTIMALGGLENWCPPRSVASPRTWGVGYPASTGAAWHAVCWRSDTASASWSTSSVVRAMP
ncbi:hypothetical protein [Xanthomonas sp. MUS 060]|uniref:hypothetical protein n=1 Tax=Xanthomonas sp. MUS 060 TaxID=1588031 RepID=UPI0005F28A6E|nr:hypothetical protein [Xanthomonas sp. MUS 060]